MPAPWRRPPALPRRLAWPRPLWLLALLAGTARGALFVPGTETDPATGDPVGAAGGVDQRRAAEPLRGDGVQWTLGPWQRSGTLSLDGRWLRLEDGRRSRQLLLFSDAEWANYLWQPWFVQLRFGLGLLAVHDSASGGNGEPVASRGGTLTGRMAVSVFPASRFPFELRADVGDSRTGGDALGGELRSQRLSVSQAWRPETGNHQLHLLLDHSRLLAASSSDTLTSLQAGSQHQFGEHNLDLGANLAVNRRSDTDDHNRLASLNVRHGFHPAPELQVETLASWHAQQLRSGGATALDLGSDLRQLSSVLSWRPREGDALYAEDRPLLLSGSARWVEVRATGSGPAQRAQAFNATLGANLDLSAAWRLSGSVSGSHVDAGNGEGSDAVNANGVLGWTPAGIPLGAWRYAPSASLNGGLSRGGEANHRQLVGVQGTHSLSRDWQVGDGQSLALNLSQSAAVLQESLTPTATRALAHSLGLFWQAVGADGASQRFAGLSLSDSRSRALGDGRFQLVNLQLSQRTQLSRQTSWSANLTLQATRNQATEVDAFTGERRTEGGGWQHFYSGGASLEQQRLFGVPRLRHTLQLSLNSQQIERRAAGDIDAPRERITESIESRIDYSVGRLELRLSARHARVDGRAVTALLARAQRRF